MKNHEGYHDPTAGKAIRRTHSARQRRRTSAKLRRLTYRIGELTGLDLLQKDGYIKEVKSRLKDA